ncbi:GNAT family N-acetyltransferase [bacterium]|nr:GNAT family N-acetyltransferase [bacterium]MBU1994314.1 GNAT family N-acetyltransferase [bacterium]
MDFRFLEVKDSELLKKVFAFRYKIVFNEYQEYIQANNLQNEQEIDIYDEYAVQFAVLDEDGEICATVRLIHNSPLGYPTEESLVFDKDVFERDKLGEMSRIFIDTKYRDLKTTKKIIHHLKEPLYTKMMELGIKYSYGSLEGSFLRLLKMFKIHYDTIGEEQIHKFMCKRYPCILYTQVLGDENPEIIENWNKQHVQ